MSHLNWLVEVTGFVAAGVAAVALVVRSAESRANGPVGYRAAKADGRGQLGEMMRSVSELKESEKSERPA